MATSGTIKTTCGTSNQYDFWAEWKRNSYSVANNTSNITITLKLKRNDGYYSGAYNLTTKPPVTLKVGGVSKTPTVSYIDTRNGVVCTFATWTGNVSHNADGTLSLAIAASFTMTGASSLSSGALSGTASITAIPRESTPTVSASSVAMGDKVTITTNRKSTSLTHDLSYSFAGSSGTIATGVGDSYQWTVPDLVSKIPNKSSGTCTITCKTRSGSTVIGTKTVTLTLTIPAASQPTASAATVKMGTSVDIYTNRKSTGYTHTITYAIGTATGIIEEGVEGDCAWLPPKSLAAYTYSNLKANCTITCETYNGTLLVGTKTVYIILAVPDATVPTLSASTVAMGDKITISMPKDVDVYTHDLSYTFAGETVEITTDISADLPWTVPMSLASKIPSETEGEVTITCKTRFEDSATVVGTESVSFTATVPDNSTTQPKVTMTLSSVHDLPSTFSDVFVAGRSKVKVAYEASSDYSTIESYLTEMPGISSGDNPYTSAVMANAGSVEVKGKVTDSRGYSTEKKESITVIDYSRPRIIPGEGKNKIVCVRCNSDGTPDPGGVKLLIQIGRNYSKVVSGTQRNYCKLSYQWKTDVAGDDGYSDPMELLARTATSDYVNAILPDIVSSNTTAYNIRLIAEDDVGETDVVTVTVPTAFATFHAPPGGHGFTLGGYHDPAKYNVFDCWFDAEFHGNVVIEEKTLKEYILSVMSEGG